MASEKHIAAMSTKFVAKRNPTGHVVIHVNTAECAHIGCAIDIDHVVPKTIVGRVSETVRTMNVFGNAVFTCRDHNSRDIRELAGDWNAVGRDLRRSFDLEISNERKRA